MAPWLRVVYTLANKADALGMTQRSNVGSWLGKLIGRGDITPLVNLLAFDLHREFVRPVDSLDLSDPCKLR